MNEFIEELYSNQELSFVVASILITWILHRLIHNLRTRIYILYGLCFLIVLIIDSFHTPQWIYFFAFLLGIITAFGEIIQKFKDEPMEIIATYEALIYHIFNGSISVFSLWLLRINHVPMESAPEKIKYVLLAGLGSMLILRSKFFNVNVDVKGQEVAFGPVQVLDVYLRFMEKAMDRIRAISRMDYVRQHMDNLDFYKVKSYVITMLYSAQRLSTDLPEILKKIEEIENHEDVSSQNKSYRLGFLLLDLMGEDFVIGLFEEQDARKAEYMIQAPTTSGRSVFSFGRRDTFIFMYGPNISRNRLKKILNWSEEELDSQLPKDKVKIGKLQNYKILLGKLDEDKEEEVRVSISKGSQTDFVEGILYTMPEEVVNFLDSAEKGYHRKKVQVSYVVRNSTKKASAFIYLPKSFDKADPISRNDFNQMIESKAFSNDYKNEVLELESVVINKNTQSPL